MQRLLRRFEAAALPQKGQRQVQVFPTGKSAVQHQGLQLPDGLHQQILDRLAQQNRHKQSHGNPLLHKFPYL